MTICIASIAGDGHVIVCSNRMVTLSLPSTEFEHNNPKTMKITDNCVASSAGNALGFVPIYEEVVRTIGQTSSEHSIYNIAEITKNAYVRARRDKLEQEILEVMRNPPESGSGPARSAATHA